MRDQSSFSLQVVASFWQEDPCDQEQKATDARMSSCAKGDEMQSDREAHSYIRSLLH